MQHLILQQFDLIGIKLNEALARGAWSLWVSLLAPAEAQPWYSMNTAQDSEMIWCKAAGAEKSASSCALSTAGSNGALI